MPQFSNKLIRRRFLRRQSGSQVPNPRKGFKDIFSSVVRKWGLATRLEHRRIRGRKG